MSKAHFSASSRCKERKERRGKPFSNVVGRPGCATEVAQPAGSPLQLLAALRRLRGFRFAPGAEAGGGGGRVSGVVMGGRLILEDRKTGVWYCGIRK